MNATPTLRLGSPAPRFVLHGPSGASLCSDDARGRPWVLAFVRRWDHAELPAIRAELRGLGAVLLVLSDDGAWWCHPDDALAQIAAPDPRFAPEVAAISRDYGVGMTDDAVFVLDGDGVVRFAHRPAGALTVSLAAALGVAGKELVARRLGLWTLTRRDLLLSSLVTGFAIALLPGCRRRAEPPPPPAETTPAEPGEVELDLSLDINGKVHTLRAEPRVSLLDALRERLALTGTKKGCDHGQCGACTVLVDGRRVLACLTFAVAAQGTKITTIEGLATGDELHPMQAAFVRCDGLQCGYCTPGQIMSAVGLLAEGGAAVASDAAIREHMSGNLCRCGAYPNIVAAIKLAAGKAG
jgi:xanthine dehydrogenase YagT iron-sulfur-binding subunit